MPDNDAFDLGPVPTRMPVTETLTRRLVAAQFPQWADLPIEAVTNGGWDNWTFHLGTDMVVRLPSAAEYAQAVEKEHQWLPALAPLLPLPTPAPLAKGRPSTDYPHPWSIYEWLDGVTASADRIADPVRFALYLADFLAALQSVDVTDGPQPGVHNWFRGGTLPTYDEGTQRSLEELSGQVDVELAREIWADALEAPWDGVDRWFHGDVAEGNLLLHDGHLSAVIDFGTCGVGDPACDLAIAWDLLTADARQAFKDRLSVDAASWARGRGWALWKTLATCASTYKQPEDAREFANAKRILEEISREYAGQPGRRAQCLHRLETQNVDGEHAAAGESLVPRQATRWETCGMLELRPSCECCDVDLPPESAEAMICTFECTWCARCVEVCLGGCCPNCGGDLQRRPVRPAAHLDTHPASTRRVVQTGLHRT